MPKYSTGIAQRALDAIRVNAGAATKNAAVRAPIIWSKISSAAGKLWNNKGVQFGAGLGASGVGLGYLNSQTQEVTKPLGSFAGIANFGLIAAVIGVIIFLVVVLKK